MKKGKTFGQHTEAILELEGSVANADFFYHFNNY
jgi:hypothetical protein